MDLQSALMNLLAYALLGAVAAGLLMLVYVVALAIYARCQRPRPISRMPLRPPGDASQWQRRDFTRKPSILKRRGK